MHFDSKKIILSSRKALKSLYGSLPVLLGVIMLLSLVRVFVTQDMYATLFQNVLWQDAGIGAVLGSVFGGNPVNSYVLAGEFLDHGVSLVAVTAFLVSWVTVGIIQLPAEKTMLGFRFALLRNLFAFLSSFVVAIITTVVVALL